VTSCTSYGRALLAAAALTMAIAMAVALGGCDTDGTEFSARALKALSPAMLAELEHRNMPKDSPILVRLFKEEAEFEVWKQDSSGRFALLKTYPICRWSGELGPKVKEGDRQAPEGFYAITPAQMNPNSHYYLAFNIGYPNAFDRAWGRTGSDLMVHGDCSSRGCYAMTDEQIGEIYALARESFFGGQRSFQVQAYPFHMTAVNMARHRNNPNMPFWTMLKQGSDHFELTRMEPKVDVCEKRYVFDAEPLATPVPAGAGAQDATAQNAALHFNPTGHCPAYQLAPELAAAVDQKRHRDEVETAELISRGAPTVPVRTGTDGGTNPAFLATYQPQQVRDAQGQVHTVVSRRAPGFFPMGTAASNTAVAEAPTGSVTPVAATPVAAKLTSADTPPSGGPYGLAAADSKPTPQAKPVGLLNRLFHMASDDKTPGASAPSAAAAPAHNKPQPATTVAAKTPAKPKAEPERAPPREARATPPPPVPPTPPPKVASSAENSLLTGAQPTVPVGSFDSRWSAIQ
jgi:murein L,D-transpeptidase YafK